MLHADTIYLNANVITLDAQERRAQALAMRDRRLAVVGTNDDALALRGPQTAVSDLHGQTVIPGLIDAHNHLLATGKVLRAIPLFGSRSVGDVQAKLHERAAVTPKGQWITGRGWDESLFAEGHMPTRHDLDAVAPDHPVVLYRVWNKLVCNTLALKAAGINRDTPEPPADLLYAGRILRDEHGEPTGVFTDRAKALIDKAVPLPSDAELEACVETACRAYNAVGLTAAVDPGLLPHEMRAYQRVHARGALTVRARLCIAAWGIAPLEDEPLLKERIAGMGVTSGFGDDVLKIDAIKFMPDGGVGDRTALMFEHYLDEPHNYGQNTVDLETFYDLVQWCHDMGWSVETHACGDRMIELTAEAYADAVKRNPNVRVRHRIHHAYLPTPRALEFMRAAGTVAIVQPAFVYNLGESYVKSIGLERARRINPYRTYVEHGIRLAGSSDSAVTDYNPWVGLYAAVRHQTVLGTDYDPRERLTVGEALKMYTRGSAYVTFEENVMGSLEAGKHADFVVLEKDVLAQPVEELKDIKPRLTVMGGREVFSR
ncbi:MAG: amidohydrolase [Chloroflexi bacterium]|nr:amidohydrolase [Chloroflexota bacterium]